MQGFEMEELMHGRTAVLPVLTYLFHRLEAAFDGRPTLLILDEAWVFLDDPLFAAPHPRVAEDAAQEERLGGLRHPVPRRYSALHDRAGAHRELPEPHLPAEPAGDRAAIARHLRGLRPQ